jgi:hypothetical protein
MHKDKFGLAGTGIFITAFFILCGLPWFQGLVKTWIIADVGTKLAKLGSQIDTVQDTSAKMQTELADHQTQITQHQKELDAQQGDVPLLVEIK